MTAPQTSQSPISRPSLTRLLAALREQHQGAPTVGPLITRAADPSLRREIPAVVAQAIRRASAAQAGPTSGSARARAVVPVNLSAVLGVRTAASVGPPSEIRCPG